MSNFKTPPNRRLVRLNRPHDFLYDPNYIMPSRQNFLNDAAMGTKSGARVKIKPIYESMFSELKSDRRFVPCLTLPQPNNLENFMPQYEIEGVPVMPMDTGPLPLPQQTDDVTGADRAKYAIRYSAEQVYHMHHEAFDFNKLVPEEKKKILQTQKTRRSGFVSRGAQTDLRESETQTDPYSPPYKLPYPGAFPKVLALIKLTWAKGLPFTLEDIVVIERALSRRLLDHTNRDAEDEEGFEKRIKLVEELEAQQWADREKELQKVLQLKMEATSRLIYEYTGKIDNGHTTRLERLQEVLRTRNVKHLEHVKHQYFRTLRKLERKYFDDPPTRKRNIIKEYNEFDSNVYAQLVRNGTCMELLNPVPPFQFDLHRDFDSFEHLTQSTVFIRKELAFDMHSFKERIRKCEPTTSDKRLEKKLEKIYAAFKDPHAAKKLNPFDNMEPNVTNKGNGRVETPVITMDDETPEGIRKPHCITIQKVARGRVIQKMIRKEIEANMNELLGMKLMFDMDPNCQRLEEGQMQKLVAMKQQCEAEDQKDTAVKEVLGNLEGETLNKMLDFLDKEMIRLIDERKIHALILLAERERRRKEAVEAGRRHLEEENRRANDEIFRQLVGIHQATVDIYLEEMFIESSDRTADEASRNLVRQMAATVNEASYSMTDIGDYEKEELAAELVSSFMIPELSRLCHREKVDAAEVRYKKAAGQVIDAIFGAHEVTKQIMDGDIPPLVQEHNIRGWAATDGSVSVVDQLIQEAVYESMRIDEPEIEIPVELVEQTIVSAEEQPKELEVGTEEIEIPVEQIQTLEEDSLALAQIDDVVKDDVTLDTQQVVEDISLPVGDIEEKFEEPKLYVHDSVRVSLAAKSLQLALDTERCQPVENLYASINEAIDEFFTEARRKIAPDPEIAELTDTTLDEDTDDD